MEPMTPREIVAELDKFIIGQEKAKRKVAIALRNRWRRRNLPPELRDEVAPKNIIMIGPTGVGKTEIARRLAKLADAPFLKVEASKYTEVGYVGRDVESMIRDLTELGVSMVRSERAKDVEQRARAFAEERLLDLLLPSSPSQREPEYVAVDRGGEEESLRYEPASEARLRTREKLRAKLAEGVLEDKYVEMEVQDSVPSIGFAVAGFEELGINFQNIMERMVPRKTKNRKAKVSEARSILIQEETHKLIDMDEVVATALKKVEESGIIFVDEIDKIAGREKSGVGPDVSREGVQRDILPIVEGCTVITKYGPVRTDHILFIAAGAFHVSKPSDLIPELQGRFPIRVELDSLTGEDFKRILTEPQNSVTKQYVGLLHTEDVQLEFTSDGIEEIAQSAFRVNEQTENIGARRLYTVMEHVLETISFEAPENRYRKVVVDAQYVRERLTGIMEDRDLSRYIL